MLTAADRPPERRHRRRRLRAVGVAVAGTLLVVALVIGGCITGATAATTGSQEVVIQGYRYGGGEQRIDVGQAVTWVNADDAPHTVTATSGPEAVSSPELAKGDRWSFTFTQPGTLRYTCTLHPDMAGAVTVAAAPAAPAVAPGSTEPAAVQAVTTVETRTTGVSPLLVLFAFTLGVAVFGALCFTVRRPADSFS